MPIPDDTHEGHPTLDEPTPLTSLRNAEEAQNLIAQALENPDLHPAAKAALWPVQWYLRELQREIADLQAPLRWVTALKDRVLAQNDQDRQWATCVESAGMAPFGPGPHGSRVWTTRTWRPSGDWVRVQDVLEESAPSDAAMTVWANPRLQAVATVHAGGLTFVERYPSAAQFAAKLRECQRPKEADR